ncbi:DUF4166 domain-containing protein [Amycolatopsis sp. NPDC003731]
MTGVFERTLGADFANLHPRMRERLALSDGRGMIGHGVMDRIWRGPAFTLPFLWLGSARHILFPEGGRNVPFTIENHPYVDGHGRETVSFVRTFEFPGRRRRPDGGFRIRSGEFRFREGPVRTRLSRGLTGTATVDEWFDDALGQFRIEVAVVHPRFGPVFGYEGSFGARYVDVGGGVSGAVKPLREKVMD